MSGSKKRRMTHLLGVAGLLGLALLLFWKARPELVRPEPTVNSRQEEAVSQRSAAPSSRTSYSHFISLDLRMRYEFFVKSQPDEKAELIRDHHRAFIERNWSRLSDEQLRLLYEMIDSLTPELFPPPEVVREFWKHPEVYRKYLEAQRRSMEIFDRLTQKFSTRDLLEFSEPGFEFSDLWIADRALLIIDQTAFDMTGWHTYEPMTDRVGYLKAVWHALQYQGN